MRNLTVTITTEVIARYGTSITIAAYMDCRLFAIFALKETEE
ncbi:hypothetical protein MHI39_07235 [Heyndrickxia sp. FSL K6-6286]